MPRTCARCSKTVYFNEERIAIGQSYHVSCFSCANESCRRRLDSNNLTEHDGDIYCRSCYGKLFGPKGYGYGGGAGVLSMDTGDGSQATSNIPATAQAFVAPTLSGSRSSSLVSIGNSHGSSSYLRTINNNQADICPRCNKVVYMAEKMMGGGSAWHKTTCFTCKECHKRLESTTLCERDHEIYCRTCYGKQWGPKGYGFGLSAGVLQPNEAAQSVH